MANYRPKNTYMSAGRLDKLVKDVVKTATEDRKAALAAYDVFKDFHDNGGLLASDYAKYMIDALKLCQTATDRTLKAMLIMQKSTNAPADEDDKEAPTSFADLKDAAKRRRENEKR